jgi:OOP family OmpA-OmpF porin
MQKFSILIALLLTTAIAYPQAKQPLNKAIKTAQVDVVMVDAKNNPRNNELVFFKAKAGKTISGRTNKDGQLSVKLPAGNDYTILIQALVDSSEYTNISIPELKEGEFFDAPMKVNIVYEPARSFTLNNVHFDVGRATLRPDSFKELNKLAEYLQWRNNEVFEIGGHTDDTGKEAENLKLSQLRAESVRNFVMKKGVPAERVVAKGYGASQPVADNATEAGKQLNRRTEVRLITQ